MHLRNLLLAFVCFGALPAFSANLVACPEEPAISKETNKREKEAQSEDPDVVFLSSNEGGCVKLELEVAKLSETLKNLIEDAGVENTIPLPNIEHNQTLLDLANVLEGINNRGIADQADEQAKEAIAKEAIESVLPKDNPAGLKRLLLASNYLDIKSVTQVCIGLFATKILQDDVFNLRQLNASAYEDYKTAFFTYTTKDTNSKLVQRPVPKELQKAMGERLFLEPKLQATLHPGGAVFSVAFSHNGSRILTGSGDNTAKLWDAKVGGDNPKPLATLKHNSMVFAVAFSPDGSKILTGSPDRPAKLWETAEEGKNNKVLATLKHDRVRSVAFSPNGSKILTGSMDGTAKLWDVSEKGYLKLLATLNHAAEVSSVAFSLNGLRILTGSWDKTAKLWDANVQGDNPQPLATLKHSGSVSSVAFSPNGSRILTGSGDNTARLWDANAQGDNPSPLGAVKHEQVHSVAFSPDDSRILTGSFGKTAKLWKLLDVDQLNNPLAELQIILFVQKSKLIKGKTPQHLVDELSDYAKQYLWGK